ncbi:MAG TPA: DUF362 domain-containing protein [Bacillota bacterium]|nr:DUF362 domain-containing protein [Bacillota bacterium]HOH10524.1 DUF362 domain-containing protein [Bacillota bacterium]HOS49830.1 DUF362 domain-containing protein [Bacillota bacterium]HOY88441.1 DUF362 domain-containing protein [Bacillota bacterium]HPI01563.1 DUF362 domain-containing protein [Bacillota bacterium]
MASKVFFTNARTKPGVSLLDKMDALCEASDLKGMLLKGDFTAIKLHVGEPGNLSFVAPQLVRRVVDKVKRAGAVPFLTDTNTLYSGQRNDAVRHSLSASLHGFNIETAGAPFIVGDGLIGSDYVSVPLEGGQLKEAKIASSIYNATALISIAHFKGHISAGIGGSLKNLGMGCASRAGKLVQHSDVRPVVKQEACLGCGKCIQHCPALAISFTDEKKAYIDPSICIGCGDCLAMCPARTIKNKWANSTSALQRKMAEYAAGAVYGKAGKVLFFNVIINVSPQCDCFGNNDVPIVPDIGIMASKDPVAIDFASAEMVQASEGAPGSAVGNVCCGEDKFRALTPDSDWKVQLTHAVKMGLGTMDYEIEEILKV